MVERCGERQRKFDGLGKWQFRLFIEGLPIMLQISLFLLACGLSRYMWSVSRSVAGVVISFTLLGLLFYIGIVIAGTCSYECPFQTPVSIALRCLKDSELLTRPFPLAVISLILDIWNKTWKSLMALSSLIHTTWVGFHQGLVSTLRSTRGIIRSSSIWQFFQPLILSGIRQAARSVGQPIRRPTRAGALPTSIENGDHEPAAVPSGQVLRLRELNLETVWRQNTDDAGCVCWVIRNITDPEALDAAVHLAGTIRWFDGGSDHDPPLDVIVSIYEACFDSTREPYPGMRNRAYFSGRAIVQINMRARVRSLEHASKYSIPTPTISATPFHRVDYDLYDIVRMLEINARALIPVLPNLPQRANTHAHSLWLSNLLVDLARPSPNPMLKDYRTDPTAARTDHRPTVANALVAWYLHLGGNAEEETFWAVDKSYVVVSSFLPPELLTLHTQPLIGNHPLQLISKSDGAYC